MQQKCPDELKQWYHGMIIDNFTCESELYEPLSVLFGEYLFYHIVDTPEAASEIIKLFDAEDLPGDANFIAMSILDNNESDENQPQFLSQLSFDDKFQKIFEHIASDSSLFDQFDSIQSEQDLFMFDIMIYSRGGALMDLNISSKKQSINLYQQVSGIQDGINALKHDIRANNYNIDSLKSKIKDTFDEFSKQKEDLIAAQSIQKALLHQSINKSENVKARYMQNNCR